MIFKPKQNEIESNFNRDEKFDFENVPKHFESITDASIRQTKRYCSELIRNRFKGRHDPSTLQAMLEAVNGAFNSTYATLEGDYEARKQNLAEAYDDGISELQSKLPIFESEVETHDHLYEEYARETERLTGHRPEYALSFSKEKLYKLKAEINKLAKESKYGR